MFLMEHPYGDHKLSYVNLMSYAIIKLFKCGGLYTQDVEQWQSKTKYEKKIWTNFRQHLIA